MLKAPASAANKRAPLAVYSANDSAALPPILTRPTGDLHPTAVEVALAAKENDTAAAIASDVGTDFGADSDEQHVLFDYVNGDLGGHLGNTGEIWCVEGGDDGQGGDAAEAIVDRQIALESIDSEWASSGKVTWTRALVIKDAELRLRRAQLQREAVKVGFPSAIAAARAMSSMARLLSLDEGALAHNQATVESPRHLVARSAQAGADATRKAVVIVTEVLTGASVAGTSTGVAPRTQVQPHPKRPPPSAHSALLGAIVNTGGIDNSPAVVNGGNKRVRHRHRKLRVSAAGLALEAGERAATGWSPYDVEHVMGGGRTLVSPIS